MNFEKFFKMKDRIDAWATVIGECVESVKKDFYDFSFNDIKDNRLDHGDTAPCDFTVQALQKYTDVPLSEYQILEFKSDCDSKYIAVPTKWFNRDPYNYSDKAYKKLCDKISEIAKKGFDHDLMVLGD